MKLIRVKQYGSAQKCPGRKKGTFPRKDRVPYEYLHYNRCFLELEIFFVSDVLSGMEVYGLPRKKTDSIQFLMWALRIW